MAAFTSKATGNWSAGGQTTWNQAGVPTLYDSATIQSTHNVTVDVPTTMGDGTPTALNVASGGTLTIGSNIPLTVYGGVIETGTIAFNSGSALNYVTGPGMSQFTGVLAAVKLTMQSLSASMATFTGAIARSAQAIFSASAATFSAGIVKLTKKVFNAQ